MHYANALTVMHKRLRFLTTVRQIFLFLTASFGYLSFNRITHLLRYIRTCKVILILEKSLCLTALRALENLHFAFQGYQRNFYILEGHLVGRNA